MRFTGKTCLLWMIGLLAAPAMAQPADTPYNCFPTCSEIDGKMMSLAGKNLLTLGGDFINLTFVSDGGGFQIGIFDGEANTGNPPMWDRLDFAEIGLPEDQRTQLQFHLLADPTGDGTGMTEIGFAGGWFSNMDNQPTSGPFYSTSVDGVPSGLMPNDNWFDIDITDAPAAAAVPNSECPAGNFCYRLLVTITNPGGATEANFKVRTTAQMTLRPLAFSFVGALRGIPDARVLYPNFDLGDLAGTTYDGHWEFTMQVAEPVSFFSIWDGDMDYGSWDCAVNDTDDPDTCQNTDPDSACVANTFPGFVGETVPPWADGTAARTEAVAIAPPDPAFPCGPTGAPPDDMNPDQLVPLVPSCVTDGGGNILHCFFTRPPDLVYELETPVGTFFNANPSGNQEWEQFRLDTDTNEPADFHVASLPAGEYVLRIDGLDAANLNALRMSATVVAVPSASIGDRVWLDTLQPEDGGTVGVQDPSEVGINGVTVRLYRDSDADGMFDPMVDELVAVQVTSGDGDYDFLGLGGGNYFVDVDESTLPPGLTLTTGNEPYLPGGPYPLAESEDHDDADFGYELLCFDCDGKVTMMKLRYLRSTPGFVQARMRKGQEVFAGMINPFEEFMILGADKKGTLGPEVEFMVDGGLNASIHTSCSQPIGPGVREGSFLVTEAISRNNGVTCTVPFTGDPSGCDECSGKVTQLTLRYTGMAAALVEVEQKKPSDIVFSGLVMPGDEFTFSGTDKKGTLSTEIRIFVDGGLHTSIHTSCSQPIGPGLQSGDFLVVEGFSRGGGLLCPLP